MSLCVIDSFIYVGLVLAHVRHIYNLIEDIGASAKRQLVEIQVLVGILAFNRIKNHQACVNIVAALPKGAYGGRFAGWVHSDCPQPYNSWGNGAAMRVSPIGWAFNEPHTIIREAVNSAKVSHDHVEGLIGASAVALAMYEAKLFPTAKKAKPHISSIARWYYGDDFKMGLPRQGVFDETCQGCVPLALYIILESDDFEDAIRKAISYGGDSDTLGAIVGSIAEPLFGIPPYMKEKALGYLTPPMLDVVIKFEEKYGNKE